MTPNVIAVRGMPPRTGISLPAMIGNTHAMSRVPLIVSRRSAANFLLLRDAPHFILGTTVCSQPSSLARLGATLALEEESSTSRAQA